MKRSAYAIIFCVVLAVMIGHSPATAQGKFGAGFVFGDPSGISWKYRINHINAVDGAIGFSPFDRFRIHADYLWHSYPFREEHLALHYGLGAAVGFGRTEYFVVRGRDAFLFRDDEPGFAARGVFGLTYQIPKSPLDTFVEVAPLVIFSSPAGFGVDAGLGLRFYF